MDGEEGAAPPNKDETAEKVDTAPAYPQPGQAWLKAEYLIPDHQRVLSVQYIAKSELKNLESSDESLASPQSQGDGEKEPQSGKRSSESSDGPASKRLKLRGKNRSKDRHQVQRIECKDKICPSIQKETVCEYEKKGSCKFSHDVADFMSKKPPDVSDKCYVFETFGYCPCGISCRFASQHITPDFKNVVNEELYAKTKDKKTVLNALDRGIQKLLWKRCYDFSDAEEKTRLIRAEFQSRIEAEGGHGKHRPGERYKAAETLPKSVDGHQSETRPSPRASSADSQSLASTDSSGLCSDASTTSDATKTTSIGISDNCSGGSAGAGSVTDSVGVNDSANGSGEEPKRMGCLTDEDMFAIRPGEKKIIDFRDKLYLAPLTTVGNLPFRRVCKRLGADITCSEMARSTALLQGSANEWALVKRHVSEDQFGIQICGGQPDSMARCAQLLNANVEMDFLDINSGCPIDYIFNHGEGCALMGRAGKFEQVCRSMSSVLAVPLTVKMRTGIYSNKNTAHTLLARLYDAGVAMVTLHGRSREQRYTRLADWDYIDECARMASPMPLFGNGDILSFEDYELNRKQSAVAGIMIGRGALIKPWIFQEIKERRHWDISANERFDILRDFVNYGLEHWGSDQHGVDHTRRFLLEWLSFFHRYIPVGIMERLPQKINERPPYYRGRNDLETLLASANCADWVKISEMLLGPVPESFIFLPKHRANAYQ